MTRPRPLLAMFRPARVRHFARTHRPAVAAAAAVLVVAVAVGYASVATAGGPAPLGSASRPVLGAGDAGKLQDPVADAPAAARTDATATRVQIPAIGVDSSLVSLSLIPGTDALAAPTDFNVAGWYTNGTVPGDVGPAVIAGHVDSRVAPGVFIHLSQLTAGDQIMVTLSTGVVKTFVVTSTMQVPKDSFPTAAVYGPTPTAQLRVITCDGVFNHATGHYLDNFVVFANLQS